MLRTADLDYHLPEDLIATSPADPRDSARLLVLSRSDPSRVEHGRIPDLLRHLGPGDQMVVNSTRVVPARFIGERADTGGQVQGLYLRTVRSACNGESEVWSVMVKARRQAPGVRIRCRSAEDAVPDSWPVELELVERDAEEDGAWVAHARPTFDATGPLLPLIGLTPLPPYILSARKRLEAARKRLEAAPSDEYDRRAYQTVYARSDGSVAAPTAGLHFTPDLLDQLQRRGVERADVVLHVGTGTFKPVEAEHVEQHPIHAEWCTVPAETVERIRAARSGCGRVIAVGTTTARALESFDLQAPGPRSASTRLLITPGHRFANIDCLMTNFHLPRSSLMAMVAAFLEVPEEPGSGVVRLIRAYEEAVRSGYRFYSFGDAMLVLP